MPGAFTAVPRRPTAPLPRRPSKTIENHTFGRTRSYFWWMRARAWGVRIPGFVRISGFVSPREGSIYYEEVDAVGGDAGAGAGGRRPRRSAGYWSQLQRPGIRERRDR